MAFLKKNTRTRLCQAYGVVQPEYVEAPAALLAKTGEMKKYFECCYEYVRGMKPKATTKKV